MSTWLLGTALTWAVDPEREQTRGSPDANLTIANVRDSQQCSGFANKNSGPRHPYSTLMEVLCASKIGSRKFGLDLGRYNVKMIYIFQLAAVVDRLARSPRIRVIQVQVPPP